MPNTIPSIQSYEPADVENYIHNLAASSPEFFESNGRAILYSGENGRQYLERSKQSKVSIAATSIGKFLIKENLGHRYRRRMGRANANSVAGRFLTLASIYYTRFATGDIDVYVAGAGEDVYWHHELPELGRPDARYTSVNGLSRANVQAALLGGKGRATLYIQRGKLSQLKKELEDSPTDEKIREYSIMMALHMRDWARLGKALRKPSIAGINAQHDSVLVEKYTSRIHTRIQRAALRKVGLGG